MTTSREDPKIVSLALKVGAMLADRAPRDELNVVTPDEPTARALVLALRNRRYFAKASMVLMGDTEKEMTLRHYVRTYRRET